MRKSLLTNKEYEVLSIFWKSKGGLTAKQIHEDNPELVLSTIQTKIKSLVKKNMLEVDEIVYSGKVLTRKYVPTISEEKFILKQYDGLDISELIMQFLGETGNDSKEIEAIENILKEKRRSN